MIKFVREDTIVGFAEIPDEVTLCLNISNCKNNCVGCHSPYLKGDVGEVLTTKVLDELIKKNDGITCICLMGEGKNIIGLETVIRYLKVAYPDLKRAVYSGRVSVPEIFFWENLDYLKIGPYLEDKGPLNKETTNQRLYKNNGKYSSICCDVDGVTRYGWEDITGKFWGK